MAAASRWGVSAGDGGALGIVDGDTILMLLAVLTILGQLAADLLYVLVDPRVEF